MTKEDFEQTQRVNNLTRELERKLPDSSWGSRGALYGDALKAEIITKDQYDDAKAYYGRLWNYAGD